MSEQTQNNSQQTIIIALVVIAVLLAAIVGVLIMKSSSPTTTAATSTTTAATPTSPTSSQLPATTASAFDAKTATKVPAGMTPGALVKAYNVDVIAGKYADAYQLLPLDTKTNYGDVNAYGTQLKSYGITSYKIGTPTQTATTFSVAAEQVTPEMPITYTWTFKKVGSQWYVASRIMGGTVQ